MVNPRLYLAKLPAPDGSRAHDWVCAPGAKFPEPAREIAPARRRGLFWTWIARLCARKG